VPAVLEAWPAGATEQAHAFQRAASAVEGRNGSLAQRPHTHRGWPQRRAKVWTVLPHFDGHAAEGTTARRAVFPAGIP